MTTEDELRAELTARFGAEPPDVVKQVQHFLNTHGWQPALVEDGLIGPKTNAAVLWWQRNNGLTADGLIGPQTVASMHIAALPPSRLQTVSGPSIPGLRQSVVDAFPDFSGKFEGHALPFMYADSKGYITTGTGNKIDPIGQALVLPWRRQDGSLANQQEITDAWNTVKSAYPGVQSNASQSLTNLRLDKAGLNNLLFGTLASFNDILKSKISGYTSHPADAQLGYNSMAWAWGPGFMNVWNNLGKGPLGTQFANAVANNDFIAAAEIMDNANEHEKTINSGIIPRVAATKQLFINADDAVKKKANFDELFYPGPVDTALLVAAGIGAWIAGGVLFMAGLLGYRYYKENH